MNLLSESGASGSALSTVAGADVIDSAHNGFVNIDIAVSDFQVVAAIRIGTDPCFVVDRRPLRAEIG